MDAILEKVWEFLQSPLAWKLLVGWITERFQALSSDSKKIIRTVAGAVDKGEQHPEAPHLAKDTIKASPEGATVELAQALDAVSPLLDGEKRVTRVKQIGNVVFNCIPIASRVRNFIRGLRRQK